MEILNNKPSVTAAMESVNPVHQNVYTPRRIEMDQSSTGQPWTTGLFDCQLHQTNGDVARSKKDGRVLKIPQRSRNFHHPPQIMSCQLAVMTGFLPCVTFGQIAEVMDEGEMSCHLGSFIYLLMMPALCSQWVMGSKYRAKLRKRYNLVEAPYEDCVSHLFCPCCSLCQEFRELKSRGYDPALGWKGVLAEQQAGQYHDQVQQASPQKQTMHK